jgi:hypothetical protein
MNKKTLAALVLLLLASCAPLVWTKPGATTKNFNTDKYTCEHSSMIAAQNTPILTNCNALGTCSVQDFNAANRNQLFNDCMVAKGWSLQKANQAQSSSSQQSKKDNDCAHDIDPDMCRVFGPYESYRRQ